MLRVNKAPFAIDVTNADLKFVFYWSQSFGLMDSLSKTHCIIIGSTWMHLMFSLPP